MEIIKQFPAKPSITKLTRQSLDEFLQTVDDRTETISNLLKDSKACLLSTGSMIYIGHPSTNGGFMQLSSWTRNELPWGHHDCPTWKEYVDSIAELSADYITLVV